jgi:hypothetical protein
MPTILSAPSADRDDESPREAVVRATSDRFLRYCLDEHDKKAVYAMAMMRRPDNELLKAMLGVTDLEPEMRSLKARHSFVLLEGKGIRLHDKLESFLQDYLRCGLAGQSPMVRELSDRAVAYLEPRLGEWTQEFTDTADYFESDRIANGLLDLVQFKFWQDVEVGWRYAVPLFVESWQYNRDWQKQLLRVIEAFQVRFDGDSKKRLQIFAKALGYYLFDIDDNRKVLLDELEKLSKRGWFDRDRKMERMTILSLQRGRLFYKMECYTASLQKYLEADKKIPNFTLKLRKDLAKEFATVGWKLRWKDGERSTSEISNIINIDNIFEPPNDSFNPYDFDGDGLVFGSSSIHGGMHLASVMGAKNIVLVGADCGTIDGNNRFDGYPEGDTPWALYDNHLRIMKEWLQVNFNCSVYSLNPFVNFNLEGHKFVGV